MLCGLADAVAPLESAGVSPERIVLVGGAARSVAVQRIAAGLFGLPVVVPEPAEYVALGAARQAAWTIGDQDAPPTWKRVTTTIDPDDEKADYFRRVRESYSAVLSDARPLLTS
jgi:xylulokinase